MNPITLKIEFEQWQQENPSYKEEFSLSDIETASSSFSLSSPHLQGPLKMNYPSNLDEDTFFLQNSTQFPWGQRLNEWILNTGKIQLHQVISKIISLANIPAKKLKRSTELNRSQSRDLKKSAELKRSQSQGLKQSAESEYEEYSEYEEEEEEEEEENTDMDWEIPQEALTAQGLAPEKLKSIEEMVRYAQNTFRPEDIRFYTDSGLVSLSVHLNGLINPKLANSMDLLYDTPVTVTLDFSQKKFLTDPNDPPDFNISQVGNPNKFAFGLVFHVKQIVQSFMETIWTSTQTSNNPQNQISAMVSMGFDLNLCKSALSHFKNNAQAALDNLLNGWGKQQKRSATTPQTTSFVPNSGYMTDLQAMGFSSEMCAAALQQTNNNFHSALDDLLNGKVVPPQKQDISDPTPSAAPESETTVSPSATKIVSLIHYINRRLRNYTQYCMICSSMHACNSEKPLVCSNPLCLFRYTDVYGRQKKSLNETITICPFTECHLEEQLDTSFQLGKNYGLDQQSLLDLFKHKYLPNNSMKNFIESGLRGNNMKVKSIDNVLRAELVIRFEVRFEEMKRSLGAHQVKFELAYHGTDPKNIDSICSKGLLVPGKDNNGVGHATDTGWYGKGIYTSPNAQISVGYCRNGGKLIICSVFRGRIFNCTTQITGQPLMQGYDSHQSPDGQEWVFFDECMVLPCYVVSFQ